MTTVYYYRHKSYGLICSTCASVLHYDTAGSIEERWQDQLRMACGHCGGRMSAITAKPRKHHMRPCPECKPDVERALGPQRESERTFRAGWAGIYLVELGKGVDKGTHIMTCPRCSKKYLCHNMDVDQVMQELNSLLDE